MKRSSLGTKDKNEAISRLHQLDRLRAEALGLAPRLHVEGKYRPLSIAAGRKLYDDHNAVPRIVGGIKESTKKRYRAILDKFVTFLGTKRIGDWNEATEKTLTDYASHLTDKGYAYKTIHGELTTISATRSLAGRWIS